MGKAGGAEAEDVYGATQFQKGAALAGIQKADKSPFGSVRMVNLTKWSYVRYVFWSIGFHLDSRYALTPPPLELR